MLKKIDVIEVRNRPIGTEQQTDSVPPAPNCSANECDEEPQFLQNIRNNFGIFIKIGLAALLVMIATPIVAKLMGISVTNEPLYWLFGGLLAIVVAGDWVLKKINFAVVPQTAKKFAWVCIVLVTLLAFSKGFFNKPGEKAMDPSIKTLGEVARSMSDKAALRDAQKQAAGKAERVQTYYPGTYHFSLKAGEQTDHWIAPDPNKKTLSSYTSHDEKNFRIIFSDGDSYPGNASVPLKNYPKYKFVAITDQPDIVLSIK